MKANDLQIGIIKKVDKLRGVYKNQVIYIHRIKGVQLNKQFYIN